MISEVRDQIPLHILLIILTLDLCLIALDVMSNANEHLGIIAVSDSIQIMLSLKEETSIASTFLYLKWLCIILFLGFNFIRQKNLTYIILAAVFTVLLVDDFLQIHEIYGAVLVNAFGIPAVAGLRAQDVGELFIMGALGVPCVLMLGLAVFAARDDARQHAIHISLLFGLLMVFGVGLDMVPTPFSGTLERVAGFVLSTIEDGGELMVGSLLVAYTWGMVFGLDSTSVQTATGNQHLAPTGQSARTSDV